MSLAQLADGILSTYVTWDDIQIDVLKIFGDGAKFGPSKNATDIGAGKGFLSRICLIDPDWQTDISPKKFVVKICSQLSLIQCSNAIADEPILDSHFQENIDEGFKKVHNAEVTIYTLLDKHGVQGIPRIKTYLMRKFSEENPLKGYIIMDYVDNGVPIHIFDNLTPEDLHQPLRAIAALEAASLRFSDEEKQEFQKNTFVELFDQFFTEKTISNLIAIFRRFGGEKLAERIDKLEKLFPFIVDISLAERLSEELKMTRVLCHGDLLPTNIIWKKMEKGFKLVALIDFQTAHFGCPSTDIVRLLNACLSGKDRRNHWKSLLEIYYGYLKEEIGEGTMPFSFEQLVYAYRLYYPLGAFLVAPMIGLLFEVVDINPDVDAREKVLELVMEKTEYMLDDMISFYEENQIIKERGF